MDEKICPILPFKTKLLVSSGVIHSTHVEEKCNGEKCAWWDASRGCCAVVSVAQNIQHGLHNGKSEM